MAALVSIFRSTITQSRRRSSRMTSDPTTLKAGGDCRRRPFGRAFGAQAVEAALARIAAADSRLNASPN